MCLNEGDFVMVASIKAKKNVDMTVGNPLKIIILFTLPLILGNIFQQCYNVVDSMVVGKFVGDNAMGAVSSSGSLINLLIGLIQGISVGAGIVIAQRLGARDIAGMRRTIHTSVVFSFVLGVIMTVVGYFLSPVLLKVMKTPDEILPLSVKYFKVYFLGVIFTLMYNCGSSIFRAIGDSRHPLYYLIVACIVNVVLDLLFVAVLDFGIYGAAFATIISQAVSAILTFIKLIIDKTEYQISFKELKIHRRELLRIISYGVPTGLQNSIISLSNVFIQSNINAFGNVATSGCGSYSKIEGFATLPSASFSMALSTYVGQNVGAGKYDRARKGGYQGLLLSMLVTEICGVLLFAFAPYLIGLFSDTDVVINMGVLETRTITPFYFLLAFSQGMSGILRGAGWSKTPMFTMIICWVCVRIVGIPIALQIDGWNTIRTIFWFYPFTWGLSFIALMVISAISRWSKPYQKKGIEQKLPENAA